MSNDQREHKEMDNISKQMIQCKKDGFGCHYGAWKAVQDPVPIDKPQDLPEGWRICAWCGKPFKIRSSKKQIYCEIYCQKAAQKERERQRKG